MFVFKITIGIKFDWKYNIINLIEDSDLGIKIGYWTHVFTISTRPTLICGIEAIKLGEEEADWLEKSKIFSMSYTQETYTKYANLKLNEVGFHH